MFGKKTSRKTLTPGHGASQSYLANQTVTAGKAKIQKGPCYGLSHNFLMVFRTVQTRNSQKGFRTRRLHVPKGTDPTSRAGHHQPDGTRMPMLTPGLQQL